MSNVESFAEFIGKIIFQIWPKNTPFYVNIPIMLIIK